MKSPHSITSIIMFFLYMWCLSLLLHSWWLIPNVDSTQIPLTLAIGIRIVVSCNISLLSNWWDITYQTWVAMYRSIETNAKRQLSHKSEKKSRYQAMAMVYRRSMTGEWQVCCFFFFVVGHGYICDRRLWATQGCRSMIVVAYYHHFHISDLSFTPSSCCTSSSSSSTSSPPPKKQSSYFHFHLHKCCHQYQYLD